MSRIVDMARTPDEKRDIMMPGTMDLTSMVSDYPPGLTICLGDEELEKLDLPADCEPGDMLALDVIVKVMTVNKSEAGCSCTLQIVGMGIEEEPENDRFVPASRANRYAKGG